MFNKFPTEVINKMIEMQVEQGNPANAKVFEEAEDADFKEGGFDWENTPDGFYFWQNVIEDENFDLFFSKYPTDSIVEAVRKDLLDRSKIGIKKYGCTLDRTDLTEDQWIQHAYEEALDLCLYLKKILNK